MNTAEQTNPIYNRQTIGDITNSGILIFHVGNGDTYAINELRKLIDELKATLATMKKA